MNIELRTIRASALIPGAFCLASVLPWQLSLPLQVQIAACIAVVIAAGFTINTDRVRWLRIEPSGNLTAIVNDRGKPFKVRSFRVPRLLSFYAELILQLDDGRAGKGQQVRLLVVPGICDAEAFRHLRNYLLQNRK